MGDDLSTSALRLGASPSFLTHTESESPHVGFLLHVVVRLSLLDSARRLRRAAKQRVPVSGSVQYNGKAIAVGGVRFIAQDQSGISTNGPIHDGKYELAADQGPTPGKYKVQITWPKKTGRKINKSEIADPEYIEEETIEQIPPKYNRDTTLEVEIKSGKNQHDFDLKK